MRTARVYPSSGSWEVAEGRLDLVVDGKPVEPERLPVVLEALLDQHLRKMAEHALLVG